MNKQSSIDRPGNNDQLVDDSFLLATPRLRRELKIDLRDQKNQLVAIIEDPVRGKFFQVGVVEYHFLMLFNGSRSIREIVQAMNEVHNHTDFDESSARTVCQWLANMNLLSSMNRQPSGRLCQAANTREKSRKLGWLNPISLRINLVNPDRVIRKILPWTQWIFSPLVFVAWMLTGLYAWSLLNADYQRFFDAAAGILSADRWFWLLIVWLVLKVVHELAHGISCQKYGGDVPQAGILMLLFAPLAFVNVTSVWRFSSRRKRMIVSAAGMYVELMLAFLAIIVWYYTESPWISDMAYNVVVMAGISTLLFNANPLLRFDGYYLLADLVGIVNLYGKGQAWVTNRIHHVLFGFPLDHTICAEDERRWVAIYGMSSFLWRIALCLSLLLIASTLFGGIGLALAIVGGVFWIALPLKQNIQKIRRTAREHPIDRRRLAIAGLSLAMSGAALFFVFQAPAVTQAPAIVHLEGERVVRAAADGFVREVLVEDGQRVMQGDRLVRTENPELKHQLHALIQEAQEAEIQSRIHQRKREISSQQAALARLAGLKEQIAEIQQQVEKLSVTAPVDGVVYGRRLRDLAGSFVKQGDVLLSIGNPEKKEIVISVDQDQIKAVKSTRRPTVRLAFAGIELFQTQVDEIEPKASDSPVDRSLTAASGGSLPVVPVDDDEVQTDEAERYRLLVPRFTARASLNSSHSRRLYAGQRGIAFVHGRDLSMGAYLILECKAWIRRQLTSTTGGTR